MVDSHITKEIVRQVVPFLSRKEIPITPENYRIWFEFFLGRKEEIKKRLDELLASGVEFTDELNASLYEDFFVRDLDRESTQKVQAEIAAADLVGTRASEMIIQIMKDILSSVESTSGYGEKLKKYKTSFERAAKLEDVQKMLTTLLKDTQEVTIQSQTVQKKLEASSEELETLHVELVNAKNEARTDNLTRLWNRRFFDEIIVEILKKKSTGKPWSLLMLDIDHFKRFNDDYGHLIGDKLLKHVAREIRKLAPLSAQVCRYGGEEFAIVDIDESLASSVTLGEKIRKEIENVSFTVRGEAVDVTISIGIAEANPSDDFKSIIERADMAMYLAKKSGRNNLKTEKDIKGSAEVSHD